MHKTITKLLFGFFVALTVIPQCTSSTVLPGSRSSMAMQQRHLQQAHPAIPEKAAKTDKSDLLISPPLVAASLLSQASDVVISIAGVKAPAPAPAQAVAAQAPTAPAAVVQVAQPAPKAAIADTNKPKAMPPKAAVVAKPVATDGKPGPPAAAVPALSKPKPRPPQVFALVQKSGPAKAAATAANKSIADSIPTSTTTAASMNPRSMPAAFADAARFPFSPTGVIAYQAATVVGGLFGMLGIKVAVQPSPEASSSPAAASTSSRAAVAAVPKPAAAEGLAEPGPALARVPAGFVPLCEWRSDLGRCWVGRQYMLAVSATPKSYVSKLVSAAAARDHSCSAFTTPQACNELAASSLMCSWEISSGPGAFGKGCRSMYMAEWDAFAVQPMDDPGAAPRAAQALSHVDALMCPGSIAQRSQACSSIYPMDQAGAYIPGICQRGTTGCAYQPTNHACITSQPLQGFIAALDARFVGKCSSVCYLKMLQQCLEALQQPAAARASWCGKQPGCIWTSGACTADVYTGKLDQWGTQIAAASQTCQGQRDEFACAGAAVEGAVQGQLVAKRAAEWVTAPINTGVADAKCPV